jgi:hypothetical protein
MFITDKCDVNDMHSHHDEHMKGTQTIHQLALVT